MKYGCRSKQDILEHLTYMVLRAPNFPVEDEMDLNLAFDCLEYGLKIIEKEDARPAVVSAIAQMRAELLQARTLFDSGEVVPACHKLQDAEGILRPIRVKAVVA